MGPKGVGLTEQNNIILGVQRHSTSGAVRTLTINGTSYKHAGVYTCQVAMSSVLQESVAQYHIVLHSKYLNKYIDFRLSLSSPVYQVSCFVLYTWIRTQPAELPW